MVLRRAVQPVYRLDHLPSRQEVPVMPEKWRPDRWPAIPYPFSTRRRGAGDAAWDPTRWTG
jgi:hypothetical protein